MTKSLTPDSDLWKPLYRSRSDQGIGAGTNW